MEDVSFNIEYHGPRVDTSDMQGSMWLTDLRRRLHSMVSYEVEVTAQIAVCLAVKMTRNQIVDALGCSDLDVRMAQQRLKNVTGAWRVDDV